MSLREIEELYRVALTWTKGDRDRAWRMVEAYLRGSNEAHSVKV